MHATRGVAAAVLAAAVLVASGCSGSEPSASGAPVDAGTGVTAPPAAAPAAGATDGAGTTLVPGGGGAGASTATSAAGGRSTTTSTNAGGTAFDGNGAPGSFAPTLLRPAPAGAVRLDLLAQAGAEPLAPSIDHVTSVLESVAGKPVTATGPAAVGNDATAWDTAGIVALADQAGAPQGAGGSAVVHLLFLHGTYQGDESVLGIAVRGDVAAVFTDRVVASSTPLIGRAGIERAVVTHEVGHLLGLVDLYLQTGRADPEHPGHSRNTGSVMYWAVESTVVTDLLAGGPPSEFDPDDLADLATIRSG